MDDVAFRMIELAGQGFHCSQILLILGLEAQGKTNPDLIRVMHSLAGGVGFTGDICGALTGGACLIGLYAGRGEPDEEEDPRHNIMISELVEWFTQECAACGYGGVHCTDILGEDPNNQKTRCPGLVSSTYEKVQTLLLENGFDLSEGR
jgi:C_GCAxxG_C_C family probable redox protein